MKTHHTKPQEKVVSGRSNKDNSEIAECFTCWSTLGSEQEIPANLASASAIKTKADRVFSWSSPRTPP